MAGCTRFRPATIVASGSVEGKRWIGAPFSAATTASTASGPSSGSARRWRIAKRNKESENHIQPFQS
jgi:hypothetical protein